MSDHTTTVVGGAPPVPGVFEAISLLIYAVFAHVWGCVYWVLATHGQSLCILLTTCVVLSWLYHRCGPRCYPNQTEAWDTMKKSMRYARFYWDGLQLREWCKICFKLAGNICCIGCCFLLSFFQVFRAPDDDKKEQGEKVDRPRHESSLSKDRVPRANISVPLNVVDNILQREQAARVAHAKKRREEEETMLRPNVVSQSQRARGSAGQGQFRMRGGASRHVLPDDEATLYEFSSTCDEISPLGDQTWAYFTPADSDSSHDSHAPSSRPVRASAASRGSRMSGDRRVIRGGRERSPDYRDEYLDDIQEESMERDDGRRGFKRGSVPLGKLEGLETLVEEVSRNAVRQILTKSMEARS